jgi:CSLREA domain-containing protein
MIRKPNHTLTLVLALFAAVFGPVAPAQASAEDMTFHVDTTLDGVDWNPGDGVCSTSLWFGSCTLRAAIMEANHHPGAETIYLPAAATPYSLTDSGGCGSECSGDLEIFNSLTIIGGSPAFGNLGWVKAVLDPGPNAISMLDIDGGIVNISGVVFQNGVNQSFGGAIYNAGTLNLTNSALLNNYAPSGNGGGLYNVGTAVLNQVDLTGNTASATSNLGGRGGAIYNEGDLTLVNVTLSDNQSDAVGATGGLGGGLYNAGTLTATNLVLSDNQAGHEYLGDPAGTGGGLYNAGTANLTNSTISDNHAWHGAGGGILNYGSLTLTNVTLSGNTAADSGGGLANLGTAGLYSATAVLNMADSDNDANGKGGGLYNGPGDSLSLQDSLIAYNILNRGSSGAFDSDCYGTVTFGGYNLLRIDHQCTFFSPGGDLWGTFNNPIDVKLGNLQDNGGPTGTHALLPGSPAIDAGNPAGCAGPQGATLATDQRGYSRKAGILIGPGSPRCDIGAYEFLAGPPATYKVFVPIVTR